MHKFFEKYIDSFEAKDAIKLIEAKVDKAEHLCKHNDPEYINYLATAYDMIEEYCLHKGVDLRTINRQ